jgi:AraC-like DNA-binding protein
MANPISRAAKRLATVRASVPVAYVRLGLDIAAERGIDRDRLLRDLAINPALLERPDGRVPLFHCVRMVSRVLRETGDAGLGYDFGLRSTLAAHGNLGYGLMSHATLGEALDFGLKYGRLRNPLLKLSLRIEGDRAVIDAREALPLGRLRQHAIDAVLVSIARIGRQLGGGFRPELELRFDCAEPAHFARYRSRLPPVVFGAGANQLRFPAEYLRRPMPMGDASAAQMLTDQCEREMALIGDDVDVAARVRALLSEPSEGYPDLEAVAWRLHLSVRTLKRRLQERGLSFLELLDEARKRDSERLLGNRALAIHEVAGRMGYSDPASFTRAFRKWTGQSPKAWREHRR